MSSFSATIQPVAKSVPDNCLPEGRKVVTFQQDLFTLTWEQTTFQGSTVYHAEFDFNIQSANQQPLTALQSLVVSFITGNSSNPVFVIDIGNNLPIYIGTVIDVDEDSCFYGIFPFITTSNLIHVDVYMSDNFDPTGLVNGLFCMGVSNFELMPVAIETMNNTSS